MSRSRCQKLRYHVKGLVKSNTHMQYQSFISDGKKVMAKIKVFVHASNADADMDTRPMTFAQQTFIRLAKKVGQTSRSRSLGQKMWYSWKRLSQGIHMSNMKAPPIIVHEL